MERKAKTTKKSKARGSPHLSAYIKAQQSGNVNGQKRHPKKKKSRKPRPTGLSNSPNPELTPKEKFICDLHVEAKLPMRKCLEEAGMDPTHCSRFFKRPNIAAYVDAKRAVKVATHKHRQSLIIAELQRVAFANLGNYLDWDADGITIKSSAELTEDEKAALAEITETVSMSGGNIKIKLHDKNKALETLAKIERMIVNRHEHGGDKDNPSPMMFILGDKNLKSSRRK